MPLTEQEELEMLRLRKQKALAAANAKTAPAAAPSPAKEESSTLKDLALSPFAGMEAGLHTASELVAPTIGNIAGLIEMGHPNVAGHEADPEGVRQKVQEALTYQPRGTAAKELAGGADTAMSLPGKAINLISKPVGGMIRGDAPSDTLRGAAGNLAEEGINQGAGFLIGKGLKGVKGMTDTSAAAAAKAAADKAGQLSKENAVRQMAKDEGLVVPSSQAADTGQGFRNMVSNLKETAGGGASISQRLASITNQPKFQGFVRKQLGLAEDKPITKDNLEQIRSQEGKAYSDIEKWPAPFRKTAEYQKAMNSIKQTAKDLYALNETKPTANKIYKMVQDLDQNQIAPKQAMSLIQLLREEGKSNLGAATSAEKKLGKAQMAGASALEDMVEKNLQYGGGGQLAKAFKAAREKIAQTYTVQDALNPATGEVDASKLYDAMKRGEPVGPELRKAAEFAGAFPKSAGVPSELGSHPKNIRRILTGWAMEPTATPKPITPSSTAVQAINRLTGSPGAVPGALIATMPKGDQQGQGD